MTRRRAWLRRLAFYGSLAAAYLIVMFPLGCGRHLADTLLLHPSTRPEPAFRATERHLTTPAGRVQVWVARSHPDAPPERYVLNLIGNASRAEWEAYPVAERWGAVPCEVWSLNYPGFGGSEGPASLVKLVPAALAAWDALAEEAGPGVPLYLDGDSMGTAVALAVAARRQETRPAAGLVLKNPPPLRRLILGRYGWFNLWLAAWPIASGVPHDLDSVANAARVTAPAVYLRAGRDVLIPASYQRLIADAHAGPSVIVDLPDADHNTPPTTAEEAAVRAAIAAWVTGD